jgi:hypothetical protein
MTIVNKVPYLSLQAICITIDTIIRYLVSSTATPRHNEGRLNRITSISKERRRSVIATRLDLLPGFLYKKQKKAKEVVYTQLGTRAGQQTPIRGWPATSSFTFDGLNRR